MRTPTSTGEPPHASVTWLATAGNKNESFITFDENHYIAMLADERRTGAYQQAIEERLAKHPPNTMTVLDIGSGPFAVLGLTAARAHAKKVYCIEANKDAAARARQEIGWAEGVFFPPGTVEVLEGFSTEIDLPEKVDILVTEIAGSVASEEGVYATIKDAQQRFMKKPHDPDAYIPYSYETVGAPAVDMRHHSGNTEYESGRNFLRVEADDPMLQLLGAPLLVEEIRFSDPSLPSSGVLGPACEAHGEKLQWTIQQEKVQTARNAFREMLAEHEEGLRAKGLSASGLSADLSTSFSGIALWPRIVFDQAADLVYDSRGPAGEPLKGHWPLFLPMLASKPLPIAVGDVVSAEWAVDFQDGVVDSPLKYSMAIDVRGSSDGRSGRDDGLLSSEGAAEAAAATEASASSSSHREEGSRDGASPAEDGLPLLHDAPATALGLDAASTVQMVCDGLRLNDVPHSNAGIARLFHFLSPMGRTAIAPPPPRSGLQGGVTLESFLKDAGSEALGCLLYCESVELADEGVKLSPGSQTRGRLATALINVYNSPLEAGARDEVQALSKLINAPESFLEAVLASVRDHHTAELPSPPREACVCTKFWVRLEEERRPPLQGCWLLTEFLPLQKSRLQELAEGGEEFEGEDTG